MQCIDEAFRPDVMKTYTIQQVSVRSGLSIPTLRYYEEVGLIPCVERDKSSHHRRYDEQTAQLIETLANLRTVGMRLEEMRTYIKLRDGGDISALEKRDMFQQHEVVIREEIKKLQSRSRYLAMKVAYWDARAKGDFKLSETIAKDYEEIIKEMRQPDEERK